MKIRSPFDRFDLHIKSKDRVLEIGPGHNPAYRSNVIVEKYIDTNYHRCGDVMVFDHQTFIHADGEKLPFKDKEFDYVICNHVLEHVEHPESFIAEICRVGKRGYLEMPSLLGEFLFPKKSHKWVILDIDGKLVMYEKSKMPGNYGNDYGELFLNYLPYQSLAFKLLGFTEGDIMVNRYEWETGVDILVNPQDEYYKPFFTQRWDREKVRKLYPPRSAFMEFSKVTGAMCYILKSKIRQKLFRHTPMPLCDYVKTHKVEHYQ